MATIPLKPKAVYRLVQELSATVGVDRPLVVSGTLAGVLRKELVAGGEPEAVREGGPVDEAALLIYVVGSAVSAADEEALRAASRARVPVVCVLTGPSADGEVPYVLATDLVHVPPGSGFPVAEIARAVARSLGDAAAPLAARLPVLRPAVCAALIARLSRQNGLIGAAVFIPGVDLPALTLNQMRLVLLIASAYGFAIDRERAVELLGVLGGGLGLRALARELLDVVPVAGWAIKGGVAYAGTRAIGEAAVRYFELRAANQPQPTAG